jgi:hypothetical protein
MQPVVAVVDGETVGVPGPESNTGGALPRLVESVDAIEFVHATGGAQVGERAAALSVQIGVSPLFAPLSETGKRYRERVAARCELIVDTDGNGRRYHVRDDFHVLELA